MSQLDFVLAMKVRTLHFWTYRVARTYERVCVCFGVGRGVSVGEKILQNIAVSLTADFGKAYDARCS